MKIIYNKHLPTKNFVAINIFTLIFARNEYKPLPPVTINHEAIHTAQIKELFYVFFYLYYGLEWLARFVQYRNKNLAYRNISFEREAYRNQTDFDYLKKRKLFSFLKYTRG